MLPLDRLVSFIAPFECLGCGQEGSLLCEACAEAVCVPLPSRCYKCKQVSVGNLTCKNCRRSSVLRHVWFGTSYEELAKQVVHRVKFERAKQGTSSMARLLATRLPLMPPATVVTHVPTATSRVRRRGYDQAELLARQLAQDLKLPYASLLIRDGQSRQVGATRQARLAQLTHAFRIPKHFPQNVSILLVDDVVTTGATIETAARILRAAGAKSVSAAVFAQKE